MIDWGHLKTLRREKKRVGVNFQSPGITKKKAVTYVLKVILSNLLICELLDFRNPDMKMW